MLDRPGAIPVSHRIFAPYSFAFSSSLSGVNSLKLRSTVLQGNSARDVVLEWPMSPGNMLTTMSRSESNLFASDEDSSSNIRSIGSSSGSRW